MTALLPRCGQSSQPGNQRLVFCLVVGHLAAEIQPHETPLSIACVYQRVTPVPGAGVALAASVKDEGVVGRAFPLVVDKVQWRICLKGRR